MNQYTHTMTNKWDGLHVKALKEDEYALLIYIVNQKFLMIS